MVIQTGKTRFDSVNRDSRGKPRFTTKAVFKPEADLYASMKASSNLNFPTSPLQYLVKCLRRESSLLLRLLLHARHFARFPVIPMWRLHSHFPRKRLSHTLQHHFLRTWLYTGVALRQLGSGAGDGSGDTGWSP